MVSVQGNGFMHILIFEKSTRKRGEYGGMDYAQTIGWK